MAKNRTPNKPIGTCPCPFKNCEQIAPLHRYRAQTENQINQRRAGKLYLRCPDHGMTQDQEWLLENGTITGEQPDPIPAEPEKPKPAATKPDRPAPVAPEPAPDPAPKPKREPWGFFE